MGASLQHIRCAYSHSGIALGNIYRHMYWDELLHVHI